MNKPKLRAFLATLLTGVIIAGTAATADAHASNPNATTNPENFTVVGGPLAAYKVTDGRLDIIETDQEGARALAGIGYRVEPVKVFEPNIEQVTASTTDAAAEQVTASAPPNVVADGAKVAVIDSGVNVNHPWLTGHIAEVGDLTGVLEDPWQYGAMSDGSDDMWFDGNGHGTHVAGIIRQNYPNVRIVVAKALNQRGQATSPWIARAITWAVDVNADVINMSLGQTDDSVMIREAVNLALARGVIVVAAAGNWGHDGSPRFYPATLPGVVAVASTDADGSVSYFSNRGDYVDIAAHGSGIVSAGIDGGLKKLSGTSMAAPKVAAVLAETRDRHRDWTAQQVIDHVLATATDAGPTGPDGAYGYGIVDAQKARDTLTPQSPAGTVTLPRIKFGFELDGRRFRISDPTGQVETLRVNRLEGRFELSETPLNYELGCFCFGKNDPNWSIKGAARRIVLRATGPYGIPYQPVVVDVRSGQRPRVVTDSRLRP